MQTSLLHLLSGRHIPCFLVPCPSRACRRSPGTPSSSHRHVARSELRAGNSAPGTNLTCAREAPARRSGPVEEDLPVRCRAAPPDRPSFEEPTACRSGRTANSIDHIDHSVRTARPADTLPPSGLVVAHPVVARPTAVQCAVPPAVQQRAGQVVARQLAARRSVEPRTGDSARVRPADDPE